MKVDKDFNEFVELFVANGVRFLVVGGYALAAQPERQIGAHSDGVNRNVDEPRGATRYQTDTITNMAMTLRLSEKRAKLMPALNIIELFN